jgi:hypothetical protein
MTAKAAIRCSSQEPATVACSAPMAMSLARPFKPRDWVASRHPAAQLKCRKPGLGGQCAHLCHRLGTADGTPCGRLAHRRKLARRSVDGCARLDGRRLPHQCEALRTEPLPLHRPLLSGHDSSGAPPCLGRRPGRLSWMAHIGPPHPRRQQSHLVGERTQVRAIFVRDIGPMQRPGAHPGASPFPAAGFWSRQAPAPPCPSPLLFPLRPPSGPVSS